MNLEGLLQRGALLQLKCVQCQREFLAHRSRNRKFCSPVCAYSNTERSTRIANLQRKDRGVGKCLECGVTFTIKRGGGTRYCSQLCASRCVGRKTMGVNRRHQPRTAWTVKNCPVCLKDFDARTSIERTYCSQKCSAVVTPYKAAKTQHKLGLYKSGAKFTRAKGQWVRFGRKCFYARSSWEANYSRYLQFQKEQGLIRDWKHETKVFWFKGIKRGCLSYLPDFEVKLNDGTREWHEVKGWMDNKSKTKLRRMAKYYPKEKLVLIDEPRYKAIIRTVKFMPLLAAG